MASQPEQLELFPELVEAVKDAAFVNPLREDQPVGRIILEALDDAEHPLHEAAKEHVKKWGRPGVKRSRFVPVSSWVPVDMVPSALRVLVDERDAYLGGEG